MSQGLTRSAKLWALGAAVPFLLSLLLLGFAASRQTFLAFAIGWPIIQIFGYAGSLKRAKGQIDHPLVKTQVMLHWMMLAILIAISTRVL
ncbi:pyridoxal phosphate biosynthetic protein [Qipengyuania sp. 1NDW9]|uniref:pyridoxal phosphate biosynthetic protein n=1 Tax=Qipengyuania xiapuensis TaxID=2867236 RepID=UPI001C8807D0|nr:pyridoxal phosphate biosynthetic protein [Qipengyuania xiapuensis]MBX7492550.1 pyridoxal phosphate biosynthetic protein [Qipengyuania xiapuensis]